MTPSIWPYTIDIFNAWHITRNLCTKPRRVHDASHLSSCIISRPPSLPGFSMHSSVICRRTRIWICSGCLSLCIYYLQSEASSTRAHQTGFQRAECVCARVMTSETQNYMYIFIYTHVQMHRCSLHLWSRGHLTSTNFPFICALQT